MTHHAVGRFAVRVTFKRRNRFYRFDIRPFLLDLYAMSDSTGVIQDTVAVRTAYLMRDARSVVYAELVQWTVLVHPLGTVSSGIQNAYLISTSVNKWRDDIKVRRIERR